MLSEKEAKLPTERAIKRGYYSSFQEPQACGVSFDDLPAWLWTLRPKEWSHIYISYDDAKKLRKHFAPLHVHLETLLHEFSSVFEIGHDMPEAQIWWVSGSDSYCRTLGALPTIRKVEWLTGFGRRPRRETQSRPSQWLHLHHPKVGGSTLCRAMFRLTGFSDLVNIPPDLSRNLSHVVKYSIRSIPCEAVLSCPHYQLSDRLSIDKLDLPLL